MRMTVVLSALSSLLIATLHADTPRASSDGAQTPAVRQGSLPAADTPTPAVVPFRDGAKIAYIDMQLIASQSTDGKAASVTIKTFRDSRSRELQSRERSVEAKQQQLASGVNLLNETARAALQADIERDTRDLTRMADDAEQDLQRMADQLQQDFVSKVVKAVTRVATEKKIDIVFTDQSAMAFRAEDLNLSGDVIRVLNAAASETPQPNPPQP
jgi:Skp family chaperone for outer membrane proteins